MPGTYSQIYIQIVFAVQGRQNMLHASIQEDVYRYMAGIVKGKDQKPLAINGMADHVHVLVGLKPSMRISDLVRDIKNNSTNFINDNKWMKGRFCWQEGYGAFSYSQSNFGRVMEYINHQKQHHQKRTFRQEYQMLLQKFNVPFQEPYLFEFYD